MILQSLYEYYQRKASDPDSYIAPRGYEQKEIPFIIVIDEKGAFVNLEDTSEGEGKDRRYGRFIVLKSRIRTGSKSSEIANYLWDHYGYVLAHPKDESSKAEQDAQKQHSTFKRQVKEVADRFPDNSEFRSVLTFLESEAEKDKVKMHPSWKECAKRPGCNLSFKVIGSQYLVSEHPDLSAYATGNSDEGEETGISNSVCLVTGKEGPIATIHTGTTIPGGKAGAKLVGFQKNSGYDSYYKEQGGNAPVSKAAEDAYTTALNVLLAKDSTQKIKVGDITILFWAQKQVDFESQFGSILTGYDRDNPDRCYQEIKALYTSVYTGKLGKEGDTPFYILGLSPNAARISVRFWKTGMVSHFSQNMVSHFEDLQMVRSKKDEREYLTLYSLLSSIAFDFKVDNLPPNMAAAMITCIMDGSSYPAIVQHQCLRRIKAEREISYPRAALLKAYINRKSRLLTNNEKEIAMALDIENGNQGYLCGRLFAVLEKIQEDAQPNLNATIKDRFYGAASATPVTVFGRLIKLSTHHLEKLATGKKVYYEKLLQSIVGNISANGMPAHLSLDDQSRFAIGYYHQRQDLFTAKTSND